jgi:glyoxylase-like metal-dependent hydrolase (beta-lactamase superfamily II)
MSGSTGVERVLAPNPSLYTGPGTNTYLLRHAGEVLVLDPGPIIPEHEAAILEAVGADTVVGVVVTHTHPDHAPLANPLGARLDAPVLGFDEGPGFRPDVRLADADTVPFGRRSITAVHTPGHTPDHLCFLLDELLFTGDHIMQGSTVVIEDASDYLQSLYLVRDLGVARLEPGHGDAIDDAGAAIDDYIDHRLERERQLLAAIADGAASIGDLVDHVYAGVPAGLRPAAVHQVRVQLTKLSRDGAVTFDDDRTERATVRLIEPA